MAKEIFDLLLRVTRGRSGGYLASARAESPAERFETGQEPLPALDPLRFAALRSDLAARPGEAAERRFGALLFDALFPGPLRELYSRWHDLARARQTGVRLALQIEPNELSSLPWEGLFNAEREVFMALSGQNTVFRYVGLGRPANRPRSLTLPLRVLALLASPVNFPALDIERERTVLTEAFAPITAMGAAELIVMEHPSLEGLVEVLHQNPVDIFYYQGHTGFDPDRSASFLLLEGDQDLAIYKWVDLLSWTLERNSVSLAVINSEGMSSGNLAYEMVHAGFSSVVTNQEPLTDRETLTFIRQFHLALAQGFAIDTALTQSRRAMFKEWSATARWASPLLVTRLPRPWLLTPEAVV